MATLKLNGQSDINNITCFSFAPTILEVGSSEGGSYTTYTITFGDFSGMEFNRDYTFTINGTTLTRVFTPNEADGYKFYMDNTSISSIKKSMVNSLTEALKRIPEIMGGYIVYMPISGGQKQTQIVLRSITYGYKTPLTIFTDIPFISIERSNGTAATELKEGNLKIDVYKTTPPRKYNSTAQGMGTYITTLSKHTNNDTKVKFDLGSIFSSMTDEGEAAQFGIMIYQLTDNGLTEIGTYPSIYNVNGYLINQGGEFIPTIQNAKIALNANRGENRNYLNNTILYVYEPTIPLSVFAADGTNSISYTLKYVRSDNSTITTTSGTLNPTAPLTHFTINLNPTTLSQSKYVDIEFSSYNLGTLRYNVIKPVRATDECQRVYWYNSWGGVSFFDFTGNRTEERKVKTTTYQDSILDYYDNDINERDYIYDKQNEITVKLSTHHIHKDGQWSLFDLQQSRTAWTYVNGERYRIIVSDLEINTTSVTDIYTATITYTYSLGINV